MARTLAALCPGRPVFSPFLGGGSVELHLAAFGAQVHASDRNCHLVEFWRAALDDPSEVVRQCYKLVPPDEMTRDRFREQVKLLHGAMDHLTPARFFIVNRASYGGYASGRRDSGYSPKRLRYSVTALERLRNLRRVSSLTVSCDDFRKSIPAHPDHYIFADPPYRMARSKARLYEGHADFDHEGLAALLMDRTYWTLCYNDCEWVRDTYAGCRIISFTSVTGNNGPGKEVVILR